nr:hypothetical protein [uncultured Chryseobacterium sp.]
MDTNFKRTCASLQKKKLIKNTKDIVSSVLKINESICDKPSELTDNNENTGSLL